MLMRQGLSLSAMLFIGSISFAQGTPEAPIIADQQTLQLPVKLSLGFGSSFPENVVVSSVIDPTLPSRAVGGEVITINLGSEKQVRAVRLKGFSTSGLGKILVRNAFLISPNKETGIDDNLALSQLSHFSAGGIGVFEEHKPTGLVFLSNQGFVETYLQKPATQLKLVVEGYYNNDASLLVEIESPDGFKYEEIQVQRELTNKPSEPPPVYQSYWNCSLLMPGASDPQGYGCSNGLNYGILHFGNAIYCYSDLKTAKDAMRIEGFCHRQDRIGSYKILYTGERDRNGTYCGNGFSVAYNGYIALNYCYYSLVDALDEMARIAH